MKGNKGPFERKKKGFERSGTLLAHTHKVFFFSVIVLKFLLARQSNRKLLLLPIFVLLIR